MKPVRNHVTVEGVRLSYLEWGAPQAGTPSLLCLHGLISTAESFDAMVEHLPPNGHVVALDLPGNGQSERGSRLEVHFAAQAELVYQFALLRGLVRPIVVGHSHGGALALELAAAHRDFACGLALLCPAHPFSGYQAHVVRFYLSWAGRIFGYCLPWFPGRLQLAGFRQALGKESRVEPARLKPYQRNLRARGTVSHILRLLESWGEDMDQLKTALLAEPLSLPALLLWGAQDGVVPASTAPGLQQVLPDAELIVLPGIGHLPNEEAARECAQHLQRWRTRVDLRVLSRA